LLPTIVTIEIYATGRLKYKIFSAILVVQKMSSQKDMDHGDIPLYRIAIENKAL